MIRPKFLSGHARVPTLGAIVRKLHAWELAHLRQHAATLEAENDALRVQLEQLQERVSRAEDCAESWRDDMMRLMENGMELGLTKAGRVVAIPTGSAT